MDWPLFGFIATLFPIDELTMSIIMGIREISLHNMVKRIK